MSKEKSSTVTFFLYTRKDKKSKKLVETKFDNLQDLYEAKRKAEAEGTFAATGAHCGL